jgi:hypothetical protein
VCKKVHTLVWPATALHVCRHIVRWEEKSCQWSKNVATFGQLFTYILKFSESCFAWIKCGAICGLDPVYIFKWLLWIKLCIRPSISFLWSLSSRKTYSVIIYTLGLLARVASAFYECCMYCFRSEKNRSELRSANFEITFFAFVSKKFLFASLHKHNCI